MGGKVVRTPTRPWKIQVAIGLLKTTSTDSPREAIGPRGPIASRGGSYDPM